MVTWILVAHRAGARLYNSRGPGAELKLIENIPHPIGRAHAREIDSDRPGRFFTLGNSARSAAEPDKRTSDTITEEFAKQLADGLAHARTQGEYDFLILVAEPRFLGFLRAKLDAPTAKLVIATLGKELSHLGERELAEHLAELMEVWQTAMIQTA